MPFNKELFLVYEDNGYAWEDNQQIVHAVCATKEDAEDFIKEELGFVLVYEDGCEQWQKPWKNAYQDWYPYAFIEAVGVWEKGEEA